MGNTRLIKEFIDGKDAMYSMSGFDERVMSEGDVVLVDRGVPVDHRPAKTRHG